MEYRINLTDDTVEKLGTALGEPIQGLEQEILDKEQEIAEKEQEIEELQQEIAEFPTIESKSITANGTYSEEGKAYSPVVVNVPQTTVEPLSVTQNGTYSEQGKAYSPVTVNVPAEGVASLINRAGSLAWRIAHGTFTQISRILMFGGTTLYLSDPPDYNVPERPIYYGLKCNQNLAVVLCWLLTDIPSTDPRPSIAIANPNIAAMFNISNQTVNGCHAYAINFKAGYDFATEPNVGHTLTFNLA